MFNLSPNNDCRVEGEDFESDSLCALSSYFIGATRSISYLSSSFGSQTEKFGVKWHWPSPTYIDLEKHSTDSPHLFGFISDSVESNPLATKVDQKCLSTYSRYNLLKNESTITKPDQAALGRNVKLVKDYYHALISETINEQTGEVVKWREAGWWPYLMTPLSLSFWIGGCGEPCYPCSYQGHVCHGNGEHALNLVIYALDQYWLTEKANSNILYPSDKLLIDYYGTIVRGPEPTIGWQMYLVNRFWNCSYCGCILFCIYSACIDPWFMRYSVVSSIMTFNMKDGIPQRLPGEFINFIDHINNIFGADNLIQREIKWDHLAQERLFIDGKTDYYTARIYIEEEGDVSSASYLLGAQIPSNKPGGQIDGVDHIFSPKGLQLPYATRTSSSGYHSSSDGMNTGINNSGMSDSIFSGFRTTSPQDNNGYIIRNVAIKYYNHNVRKDIFEYSWLYVDIPKPFRVQVTPTITSFDSFSMPPLYFESFDPLVIMRKNVYFKTIISSGDIVLNGNGNSRFYMSDYVNMFNNKPDMNERHYPFLWTDRIEQKIVKAPYNLYFKSGEATGFRECLLGDMLYDLEPGRYYFPNPYGCSMRPRMTLYDPNVHAGQFGRDYDVYDYFNHKKYFSTHLPMQFLGITGENRETIISGNDDGSDRTIKRYDKMLKTAIEILGNPEIGAYAISAKHSGANYIAGPIDEFPDLTVSSINGIPMVNWLDTGNEWYRFEGFDRVRMLEDQKGAFLLDLRNYDKKWWSGFNF